MSGPVLIACSHGTRSSAGRAVMDRFRNDLARARAGLRVETAHVDVQEPFVAEVVDRLRREQAEMVVVPLLLSTGFHVRTDIGSAVTAGGGLARAAPPLGPDPLLVRVLQDRLTEAGATTDDLIVLAAAGSSDPAAGVAVQQTARDLAAARGGAVVRVAYAATGGPSVTEAVEQLRAQYPGRPVTLACYLLAPGHFVTRLGEAGADRVSGPLAPHPALVDLALQRFDLARRPFDPADRPESRTT